MILWARVLLHTTNTPLTHFTLHTGLDPSRHSLARAWLINYVWDWQTYLYPARISISDDLPAPLGPMIALSWPGLNLPEIHFKIVLYPTSRDNISFISYFHLTSHTHTHTERERERERWEGAISNISYSAQRWLIMMNHAAKTNNNTDTVTQGHSIEVHTTLFKSCSIYLLSYSFSTC